MTSCSAEGIALHLSNERMIVILAVGALAGWLIGKVLRGNGFGLVGDAAVGIVGALIGDWLLPRFNFHIWSGLTGLVMESAVGAIVLLVILRSVGASGWGGGRYPRRIYVQAYSDSNRRVRPVAQGDSLWRAARQGIRREGHGADGRRAVPRRGHGRRSRSCRRGRLRRAVAPPVGEGDGAGEDGRAGGRRAMRDDPRGPRPALSRHHRHGAGAWLRSHRHGLAWAEGDLGLAARQRNAEGADALDHPGAGLPVSASPRPCVGSVDPLDT